MASAEIFGLLILMAAWMAFNLLAYDRAIAWLSRSDVRGKDLLQRLLLPPRVARLMVLVVLPVVILLLYWTSVASDACKASTKALMASPDLRRNLGRIDYALLLGAKEKISGFGTSCARFSYLVAGHDSAGWVTVLARKRNYYQGEWEVYEIVQGFFAYGSQSCNPP